MSALPQKRTCAVHKLTLAVQRVIRRDNLLANVHTQGAYLLRRLKERFGNHPFVGDVRGRGLLQGLELVTDRSSKDTFDPKLKLHARVKHEAMARGLMVYPMGGTVDGECGITSCWHRLS